MDGFSQKEINSARGVIRRRRTNFEKKVRRQLPLFADNLIADYVDRDPVEQLQIRAEAKRLTREGVIAERIADKKRVGELRKEVRALCADDEDFLFIVRRGIEKFSSSYKWRRWLANYEVVKLRRQPLSPAADLVGAWLEQETEPVSHFDIWRRRGDGLTPKQVVQALNELSRREMAVLVKSGYSIDEKGLSAPCAFWMSPINL